MAEEQGTEISVKDSLKYLLHNKYIFLFGIALLFVIVLQSMGSIQTYYFTYIVGDLSKLSVANTFSMASLFVTPLYPLLAKKFGKRNMALGCFLVGGVVSLVAVFFTTNYVALGIINTVRMIAFGSINVMPALYTIDCMKYTEWKDGVRLEGVVAAVVSLATKIGAAVALLLTGVVLEMFGYDGNLAVQSQGATNAIWWMYIILTALIMFACAIVMYFYKIEKQMPQIEKELAERAEGVNAR